MATKKASISDQPAFNYTAYLTVVQNGKAALEAVNSGGAITESRRAAMLDLASETIVAARYAIAKAGKTEESGQEAPGLRDRDYNNIIGDAWNLADYALRNMGDPLEKETAEVAKEMLGTNGAWALDSMIREIIERPTRKTVDTAAAGAGFTEVATGTPAWARDLIADVKAIKAAVVK